MSVTDITSHPSSHTQIAYTQQPTSSIHISHTCEKPCVFNGCSLLTVSDHIKPNVGQGLFRDLMQPWVYLTRTHWHIPHHAYQCRANWPLSALVTGGSHNTMNDVALRLDKTQHSASPDHVHYTDSYTEACDTSVHSHRRTTRKWVRISDSGLISRGLISAVFTDCHLRKLVNGYFSRWQALSIGQLELWNLFSVNLIHEN